MSGPVQLAEFFTHLRTGGEAVIFREELQESPEDESAWHQAFLEEHENLPGLGRAPLPWNPKAAKIATAFVYRLCQALTNRALGDEKVRSICASRPPAPSTPGEILPNDLSLRYLPEIYTSACAISETDPLVGGLEEIARVFPFSSVGIPLGSPADLTAVRAHEGLWLQYIDRVIERQDISRLADPAVRLAVADALGEHGRTLAPRIAAQLALDSQAAFAESSVPSNHEPS